MRKIIYTGNGTVPVDSGLPHVGRMFGVDEGGDLRYYRYLGNGASNPSGSHKAEDGTPSWDAHTGNPIGNGWQGFLHVLGCGDGVIMAVEPNGDLRWYRYDGDGTADRSGALGWDPASSNIIGNGFHSFVHLFAKPAEGLTTRPLAQLFGVEPNGDLRWYGYSGNGDQDPTGVRGWHKNSGNVIGNGWADFQYIVGTSDVFAVKSDGSLLWYRYNGHGEADHSGATGWDTKSSSQIGRGWQDMRMVTGGSTDHDGRGTVLFAVDPDGKLLWYRYNGHGQPDPTGALGWDPRSATQIGRGF